MTLYNSVHSCGVMDFSGLARDVDEVEEIFRLAALDFPRAFIVFSDTEWGWGKKFAERLKERIRDYQIGTLTETEWRMNPNSGNMIKVWVFGIDKDNVYKWPVVNIKRPLAEWDTKIYPNPRGTRTT